MTLEYGMVPDGTPAMDLLARQKAGQLVVGAYIRVSTKGQGTKGTSIDTQTERCEQIAREIGQTLDPRYTWVEMESGAYLERPVMDEVRRAVSNREIDILIISEQDRLSRDMIDPVIILRECMEAGVEVRFAEGPSDTSLIGQFLMLAKGFAAQTEWKKIAERSLLGKHKIASQGQRMPTGTGTGVFGYDYDPALKRRVINEREAAVYLMAIQWSVDGFSAHRIACMLNEKGLLTKTGKLWSQSGVRKVLTNERYTGIEYFGKARHRRLKGGKTQITPKPESEWHRIEGFTPPLVSPEFWQAAQEKLKASQARWKGKTKRRHLLTGLTFCGKCGGRIIGNQTNRGYSYYRCTNTISAPNRPVTCDALGIRLDKLETAVWGLIVEAVRDPEIISGDVNIQAETGEGNLGEVMKEFRREIDALTREEGKLLGDYLKDKISPAMLENRAAQVKEALEAKRRSLNILEEQQKAKEDAAMAGDRVKEYCQKFQDGLEELDAEGKRALFSAFGVKVTATRDELQVAVTVNPSATTMYPSSR